MTQEITIIDYGVGNLLNVVRAFQYCGADIHIVDKPHTIDEVGLLVLPGVGAFSDGMNELNKRGFIAPIMNHVKAGKPLMGICLGMQMLFDTSEEFGHHSGLGIIEGGVIAIPDTGVDGLKHKIPHIGWNELLPVHESGWSGTILDSIGEGSTAYFVHSYMANPVNQEDLLANCIYDGRKICAAIQRENVIGLQFHPEKSGNVGLQIIRNFINYS